MSPDGTRVAYTGNDWSKDTWQDSKLFLMNIDGTGAENFFRPVACMMGQTVTGATTIAMYTYAGDLNFDGLVDGADYGVIDNSVQFPGTDGYVNGDFNYDGVIDGADYGVIDNWSQFPGTDGHQNGDLNFDGVIDGEVRAILFQLLLDRDAGRTR